MATTITDGGNYLILDNGTFKKYVSKPYDVLIRQNIVDSINASAISSLSDLYTKLIVLIA